MQHIDFGDHRDSNAALAFAPAAVHQRSQAGVTDGLIPPRSFSPHRLHPSLTPPAGAVASPAAAPAPCHTETAMRLFFATVAAALAALAGEVVEFEGVGPR